MTRRLPMRSRIQLRRLYRRKVAEGLIDGLTDEQAREMASVLVYGGDTGLTYPDGIRRPDGGLCEEAEVVWFAGIEKPQTRITDALWGRVRREMGGDAPDSTETD